MNLNENNQTNWGQAVAGILSKDNKILLVRHTYGDGHGKLIIPGGFVNIDETPQNALVREFQEETGMTVNVGDVLGIRFNKHDWYVVFAVEYVSGNEQSDQSENSEVVWVESEEILLRDDVPDLTKVLVRSFLEENNRLHKTDYEANPKHAPSALYC